MGFLGFGKAAERIKWRSNDDTGFVYQANSIGSVEEDKRFMIAVPGKGMPPHQGPQFRLLYDGNEVLNGRGGYPNLRAAQDAAERLLPELMRQGAHHAA